MPTRYIKSFHDYLLSFVKKTRPLVDIESQQRAAETEFNQMWEAEDVKGWEETSSGKSQANGTGGIWCSACKYRPVFKNRIQLTNACLRSKKLCQTDRI
jgi:hypothetical protein